VQYEECEEEVEQDHRVQGEASTVVVHHGGDVERGRLDRPEKSDASDHKADPICDVGTADGNEEGRHVHRHQAVA
jgi:hypothetical protein